MKGQGGEWGLEGVRGGHLDWAAPHMCRSPMCGACRRACMRAVSPVQACACIWLQSKGQLVHALHPTRPKRHPALAPTPSPAPLQRLKWDAMLHRTELVEAGRELADEGEQVVLWHRK